MFSNSPQHYTSLSVLTASAKTERATAKMNRTHAAVAAQKGTVGSPQAAGATQSNQISTTAVNKVCCVQHALAGTCAVQLDSAPSGPITAQQTTAADGHIEAVACELGCFIKQPS
jgi:hypothetical protein